MARQCVSLIEAHHSLIVLQPQGDACRKLQRPEEAAAGYKEAVRHLQSCAAPSAEVRSLLLRVSCSSSHQHCVHRRQVSAWLCLAIASARLVCADRSFLAHILGHNLPASSKRL